MNRTLLSSTDPAEDPPSASCLPPDEVGNCGHATIRRLSDRLIAAQRPLRLLDAVNWDDHIERAFFDSDCREFPLVNREYYLSRPLPFDPDTKRAELAALALDVKNSLGSEHPAGRMILDRCEQYRGVVDLVQARGTRGFGVESERLFGNSRSVPSGGAELRDLARSLAGMIDGLSGGLCGSEDRTIEADAAAELLSSRLGGYFRDTGSVRVRVTSRLASDASAGTGYLKLRAGARFSERDLRLLEVHEGWVHLGTTLNGLRQPICTFLSRSAPATTPTQEGLAVLVEVLAFASHPARLRRLAQRVEAVALAEAGANFLEVYRHFVSVGCDHRDSYRLAARTFRGSLPNGKPFTKDLSYSRGLVELCAFLRGAIRQGQVRLIPLLFVGKTSLSDVPLLTQLADDGLLTPPAHVPPPFADLRALCAWLCCAGWLASAC
jgi:uncharacterized protein (TIGR02421 family)